MEKKSARGNNQLAIERGEIMENVGSKQQSISSEIMENVGSKQQSISKRAPRKNEVNQIKCQNKN